MQSLSGALNPTVVSVAFGAGIGLSTMLVSLVIGRAAADVPDEDRTYLDRPPIGFRLVWWPIQWISYYLGRLIPTSRRQAVMIKLRKAGLDYTMSPEQYIAGRIVAALLAAALAAWLADSFLQPPKWYAIGARQLSPICIRPSG